MVKLIELLAIIIGIALLLVGLGYCIAKTLDSGNTDTLVCGAIILSIIEFILVRTLTPESPDYY